MIYLPVIKNGDVRMRKNSVMAGVLFGVLMMLSACGSKEKAVPNQITQENQKMEVLVTASEYNSFEEHESSSLEDSEALVQSQMLDEDMIAFADSIKAVVAAQDMLGLSDLLSFPTYIGKENSDATVIQNAEEFLELDTSYVLTDELVKTMAEVDTSSLSVSKAGIVMGAARPNIIFNVLEGNSFGITGIND